MCSGVLKSGSPKVNFVIPGMRETSASNFKIEEGCNNDNWSFN